MRRDKVKKIFAALVAIMVSAGAALALVATPGEVVPLRLQITSAGKGVTGLKPTIKIIRQDGTVFRGTTTMVPSDGMAGVYGFNFTCPAGNAHYNAYENNTGTYALSDVQSIDATNMSGGSAYANNTGIEQYLASKHGAGQWGSGTGTGGIPVDETFGGTSNDPTPLAFLTASGGGIGGATIYVYVKTEYASLGRSATVRGWTSTLDNGFWASDIYLNHGVTYTVVYTKSGYTTVTKDITP